MVQNDVKFEFSSNTISPSVFYSPYELRMCLCITCRSILIGTLLLKPEWRAHTAQLCMHTCLSCWLLLIPGYRDPIRYYRVIWNALCRDTIFWPYRPGLLQCDLEHWRNEEKIRKHMIRRKKTIKGLRGSIYGSLQDIVAYKMQWSQ